MRVVQSFFLKKKKFKEIMFTIMIDLYVVIGLRQWTTDQKITVWLRASPKQLSVCLKRIQHDI